MEMEWWSDAEKREAKEEFIIFRAWSVGQLISEINTGGDAHQNHALCGGGILLLLGV